MSLEMAHKVLVPQKKIMSRSFLNSGTLIVILLQNMVFNRTHHPPLPPSHTLVVYTVLWHREGVEGGELNWIREKVRGATVHRVKNTNMTDKLWQTPAAKSLYRTQVNFFKWRLWVLSFYAAHHICSKWQKDILTLFCLFSLYLSCNIRIPIRCSTESGTGFAVS
jgi:hypothetical protein